jgi:hypothetical protein
MIFRTEITPGASPIRIKHQNPLLFIGSCFTGNVGKKLEELRFPVRINPFGVVYNPLSLKRSLDILLQEKFYTENDLHQLIDLWYSWDQHSSFSDPDNNKVIDNINKEIKLSSEHLKRARVILITFGTAWVYRLKDSGQVVCNCHKAPQSIFNRELLEVNTIVDEFEKLYADLKKINPSVKFIFTISPVRHWKDGAHGNQISKSVIHLAVEKLREKFGIDSDYFPAYEILLDDLRDYRYYDRDLIHPNQLAIDYIWEKFSATFFDSETKDIISGLEKILKSAGHRVNFPGTSSYLKFKESQQKKIAEMEKKYPYLDLKGSDQDI